MTRFQKYFMRNYRLNVETVEKDDTDRVQNDSVYRRDSIRNNNKGYANNNIGNMGGKHWTYFYIKEKKNHITLTILVVVLIDFTSTSTETNYFS